MALDSFVSVNSCDNHQQWDTVPYQQEFVEILDTQKYLCDCAGYLTSIFQQAERDVPRIVLKIRGVRIRKIEDLTAIIPEEQLDFVLTACTQTLWGYPYEVSTISSQLYVHEKVPHSPCRIYLKTSDKNPPFTINKIYGTKVLGASSQEDIDKCRPPRYKVKITIDMDASITSISTDVRKRKFGY
jgi:hypothetical protein